MEYIIHSVLIALTVAVVVSSVYAVWWLCYNDNTDESDEYIDTREHKYFKPEQSVYVATYNNNHYSVERGIVSIKLPPTGVAVTLDRDPDNLIVINDDKCVCYMYDECDYLCKVLNADIRRQELASNGIIDTQ